jgi:hypothetical protein
MNCEIIEYLLPKYSSDILRVCRSNASFFVGKSDDRADIVIEIGRSPENDNMIRITLRVRSCFQNQGIKVFDIDVELGSLFEILENGREDIIGNMKKFDYMNEFYECFDVPNWHDDCIEDFAFDNWTICHDSYEEFYWQLYEEREEIFELIDYDINNAVKEVLMNMISTARCRNRAASMIQKHWRVVSSSPYTTIGQSVIIKRFLEMLS